MKVWSSILLNNLQNVPYEADHNIAQEQALAVLFILGLDEIYISYVTQFRNCFLEGNDIYPTTVNQAYNILQQRYPRT
jgi:hypothetical protein